MKRRSVETLGEWLNIATRRLSFHSKQRVRQEIYDHATQCWQDAIDDGATNDDACRTALESLGDPKAANREYRKVLLTGIEEFTLSIQSRQEDQSSYTWLGYAFLLGISGLLSYHSPTAISLFLVGMLAYLLLTDVVENHFSPRTRLSSRIYRTVRYTLFLATLFLFVAAEISFPTMARGWMIFVCCLILFFAVSSEWIRSRLRKKLPVEQWPSHLYL